MPTRRDAGGIDPGPEPPACDDRPIWDVWLSMHHYPALSVADELGLFPLLERSPATSAELAKALSLKPRAAEALLGLLAALGFLVRREGVYHLSEISRNFLLPGGPHYWGSMFHLARAIPFGHAPMKEALLKDRRSDEERITERWDRGDLDLERVRAFTRAMHSHSAPAAAGLARLGRFAGVRRLLDVGGGSGCFSIALARADADLRCTILDLPIVCKVAEEYVADAGLGSRVGTHGADMFRDDWPSRYEGVFFSNVFHDWDRTRCLELARRSFEALEPGGRIFLHEMLLADTGDGPLTPASFSMHMMIFTEGKQFTAGELRGLLEERGFVDFRAEPASGYYSLVSARRPPRRG